MPEFSTIALNSMVWHWQPIRGLSLEKERESARARVENRKRNSKSVLKRMKKLLLGKNSRKNYFFFLAFRDLEAVLGLEVVLAAFLEDLTGGLEVGWGTLPFWRTVRRAFRSSMSLSASLWEE